MLTPDDPAARALGRAQHLASLGRFDEALALLTGDSALAADADALALTAACLHSLDRQDGAVAAARSALAIEPDHVGALRMLAWAHRASDLPVEALKSARLAVAVAPHDIRSLEILALSLGRIGQFNEAIHHAHQVRSLAPDDPLGWRTLASVQLDQQRWSSAETSARAALQRDPEDDSAKIILGVAQAGAGGTRARNASLETLVGLLRSNPNHSDARQLLLVVARSGLPSWPVLLTIVLLAFVTSGLSLLVALVVWSVRIRRLWTTLPEEVRALIWADRKSRWMVIGGTALLGSAWLAVTTFIVAVVFSLATA